MRAKLLGSLALCGAVVFTGLVHARIEPRTRADRGEAYVPTPRTAKTAALGFDAVVADYYWLQAIQAVGGDRIVDAKVGRHVGKLIDVVTTLDPWVDHPYRFAALWMTEGEANVRTAIALLRRGIEYHPDEWRNWFYLGFDHFYYLGETEEAADALQQASSLPGSPTYLPRLVARLRSADADIDVSVVFLRQLLDTTEDDGKRAVYQAALDEIEVEQKARFLDRARSAYRELAGRDIERVEDLTTGTYRVIEALPRPAPDALPASAARQAAWEIDEDGRIVSTYYGNRYELHYAPGRRVMVDGDDPGDTPGDASGEPQAERAATDEGGVQPVSGASDEGGEDA